MEGPRGRDKLEDTLNNTERERHTHARTIKTDFSYINRTTKTYIQAENEQEKEF